jgi:predicted nucleic acid-binding protein
LTAFFDTNIFVYAMSGDARGIVARDRLRSGGVISTQVLNEFVRVSRKKLRLDWAIVEAALMDFRALVDDVRPVALPTHEIAVSLAKEHGLDIYDALIVAAAIEAGCDRLLSEDLQHGRKFGDCLIVNPFIKPSSDGLDE